MRELIINFLERFKINPVSYYWGNDFQKKIEDIRQMIQSRKEIRGNDNFPNSMFYVLVVNIDIHIALSYIKNSINPKN